MSDVQIAVQETVNLTTCPAWCSGEHQFDRNGHPDDAYVIHLGHAIDRWTPDDDASEEIDVRIIGTRFERKEAMRWPDAVCVYGEINRSLLGGLELQPVDAQRLAQALAEAAVLLKDSRR